jgi:hypothetical protein
MSQHKPTAAQQRRVEELQDENGWPRIYTYPVQGKTIIGQFRRYVTQEDSEQIGHALYDFLKGTCGFIAEHGLIAPDGNFRMKWAEPADLMQELANGISGGAARRGRAQIVYADGMTDVEVLAAIDKLADEHRAGCEQGRSRRRFNREISIAISVLEPHGFTIVPPGWRLASNDERAGSGPQERPGSLAAALVHLAARNGLTLIAPPAVEADGQVRLL